MMETTIEDIAKQMLAYATEHPWHEGMDLTPYMVTCRRGLVLQYVFIEASKEWRLSLARITTYPVDAEIAIIRKVFNVPMQKVARRMYAREKPGHPTRFVVRLAWDAARANRNLRDGEPCGHPGCLSHITHPCEGCGRIAGRSDIRQIDSLPITRKPVG